MSVRKIDWERLCRGGGESKLKNWKEKTSANRQNWQKF